MGRKFTMGGKLFRVFDQVVEEGTKTVEYVLNVA
jgi:hypothetical protein